MQTLACCEQAGREMATGKQPQNWIKVCYTPHGAGNVPASQTDGRTHAPAIASDAGAAGSIVLHATQYDCEEREREDCGDPWQGRAGRVKELSLVSHKLKLVPPRRKLATGQPYTARVICGILFTVHLTNAHIARTATAAAAAGQESRDNARD